MSWAYLEDASGYRGFADKVLIPASEEELLEIVTKAKEQKIPLTIAGAGSGLTGGRCPEGGWLISTEKLKKLEVHSGYAVCGAGVNLVDLHAAAKASGQFYPPDPTETLAAIGGTISCNASGSRSFKFGATRRWVEGLRVILMNGKLLDIKRGDKIDFDVPEIPLPRARKHSAGYPLKPGMDWVDLFVGSEGTLGIIVEATLKLLPIPGSLLAGIVFFPSEDAALDALDEWRTVERLRMLEYIDGDSLEMIRSRIPEIPRTANGALIIEQEEVTDDDLDSWETRMTDRQAMTEISWFGSTDADRERFRKFRHTLPETALAITEKYGLMKLGSDFAAPVDRHREMMRYYRKRIPEAYQGRYVIFGHVGDGHYHINLLPANQEEFDQGYQLFIEFAKKAVELDGTVAAEHGLGKKKKHYLPLQFTSGQIASMQEVKKRLDPDWLLGRGTLFEVPPEFAATLTPAE